jgi:hypothetical protein
VCDGVVPVPVSPSPNCQAYEAIEPSASADAPPSNAHPSPPQSAANAAVGGWFGAAATVTVCVTVRLAPSSSVTVSATS